MAVVYGFKRSNNPVNGDNTLWLYNEGDGTVTLTIKREPVGEVTDPYPITWFKLNWYHWNGLTDSDYTVLTKPQADSRVDGHYYFENGQTEFDIKIKIINDSIDESALLEGLTAEIMDVQELTLDPHVVSSTQHDTLSPVTSIGIVDDDKTTIGLKVKDATGNEGGNVGFVVEANKPAPHDTTVYLQVQPTTTTAGIAGGNWWVSDVIKAGKTSTTVDIRTVADTLPDNTRIDVKLFSYDESFVITDGDAVGVVNNTTPITSLITIAELQPYENAFSDLEQNVGTSTAISTVQDESVWLRVAKTLAETGSSLIMRWVQNSLELTTATTYASVVELPDLNEVESAIANAMPFPGPFPGSVDRNESVYWSFEQAQQLGHGNLPAGNLKEGDYVYHKVVDTAGNVNYESRLVLDELPVFWYGVAERDGYIGTRSIQGRDSGGSHNGNFTNSLDISPVDGKTMYVVAPASGTVIYMKNTATRASDNSGPSNLGNVVTLQLDQTTASGKPIFMTFAHMEIGSVPVSIGQPVVAGQVLGIVGDTGGDWDKHLHFQVGTELRSDVGNPSVGKIVDANGVEDSEVIPPVYFSTFQQDERTTVVGDNADPGFPDDGIEFPVIIGINPTFEQSEFDAINPTLPTSNIPPADSGGGTGGDFPIPDPVWNGTSAAETNEYWEDKVSNVNEFVNGGAGYDFILGSGGNDTINGEADSGQVNLFGQGAIRANLVVTTLSDGGYQVHSIDGSFGTDRYYNIDGAWFGGNGNIPGAWHNMADLVINTFNDGDGTPPTATDPYDELFAGTSSDDLIIGGVGIDWFTATPGNDILYGGDGVTTDQSWNQVNFLNVPFSEIQWGYDVSSDLLFSRHTNLGLDTYSNDITDFWAEDGGWHDRAELIGLASPTFEFV